MLVRCCLRRPEHTPWARLASTAGAAAALRALAPFLPADQLPSALDFLLSRGLADAHLTIREGMIAAGALPAVSPPECR